MVANARLRIERLSPAQRFMLGSLAILAIGMAGIGAWVTSQIKEGVVDRTAATTALYVDSLVAPPLLDLTGCSKTPRLARKSSSSRSGIPLDALSTAPYRVWSVSNFRLRRSSPTRSRVKFPRILASLRVQASYRRTSHMMS